MPRACWKRDELEAPAINQMRSGRRSSMAWLKILMRSSAGRSRKRGNVLAVVGMVAMVDILGLIMDVADDEVDTRW